jgi:uncharacterized protein
MEHLYGIGHSFFHSQFWHNFTHNLFKPLLLFFYMGFAVPLLKVPFEFPVQIYQGLTIFLLVSIGWKGGEELASLGAGELKQALGFMVVGFITNFLIGILAYNVLRRATKLRRIDAATVAGYYGSDSAGTYATCVGVLGSLSLAATTLADKKLYGYAAYMPVMLAIMEVPGCLVALFLVGRLRQQGMDALGNAPDEPGYNPKARRLPAAPGHGGPAPEGHGERSTASPRPGAANGEKALKGFINLKLLHELFLNQGLYLLFGGIIIGFVSRLQGEDVTKVDDPLFNNLFQGLLCLFLLEMGITACQRLKDLKTAGWRFIVFAIVAPNIFATVGMCVAHIYSRAIHEPFQLGTYVLFAVLCAAASYIAVPAIQRLAIPEASPTLPLAASLGCTFSYNVTIGIPVYIEIAKGLRTAFPHAEKTAALFVDAAARLV